MGRLKRVVIEETNRKAKQELIAIVDIPIIADFHLLDLDIKVSFVLMFDNSLQTWRISRK